MMVLAAVNMYATGVLSNNMPSSPKAVTKNIDESIEILYVYMRRSNHDFLMKRDDL